VTSHALIVGNLTASQFMVLFAHSLRASLSKWLSRPRIWGLNAAIHRGSPAVPGPCSAVAITRGSPRPDVPRAGASGSVTAHTARIRDVDPGDPSSPCPEQSLNM
jgi:hypothetical protein